MSVCVYESFIVLNPNEPSFLKLGKHLVDLAISSIRFLEFVFLFTVNANSHPS